MASILPLVALFQIFDGMGAVTNGVLRARGRQVCLPAACGLLVTKVASTVVYGRTLESFVSR